MDDCFNSERICVSVSWTRTNKTVTEPKNKSSTPAGWCRRKLTRNDRCAYYIYVLHVEIWSSIHYPKKQFWFSSILTLSFHTLTNQLVWSREYTISEQTFDSSTDTKMYSDVDYRPLQEKLFLSNNWATSETKMIVITKKADTAITFFSILLRPHFSFNSIPLSLTILTLLYLLSKE